jgi:hypothetical protein
MLMLLISLSSSVAYGFANTPRTMNVGGHPACERTATGLIRTITHFLKECVCSLLALMELEVEQWSGPVPMSEPKSTPGTATATAKEAGIHRFARWNWRCPGLGT